MSSSTRGVCFLASILTWWSALARKLQKFVRGCARGFAVHPSLDLAPCITVSEGHGLGEMRQLSGSNEGGSREGREKKNAREGTCLAPSRGMREREHERTRAGKCGKRRGNRISKEHQKQTSIKEKASQLRKANEKPRPAPSLVFKSSHQRGAKCCH